MKHTPGPWKMTAVQGGWDGVTSGCGEICKLSLNIPENACLIAAAPDLLAACKMALKRTPFPVGHTRLKEMLEDAIAKAEEAA